MRSLAVALLLALVALATSPARGDSCELKDQEGWEPGEAQAELAKCEEVARVSTSVEVRFAALCRGATWAYRLAEPQGDRSSEHARHGMELAERARKMMPGRVEGHYKYAICLGLYLRENTLSGFTRVDDLITAAKRAVELDETYDRGGPHRLLALLYAEAPRFVGPGDRDLARKHLARLIAVAGEDEENKLAAVKVHMEIGEKERARELLKAADPERGRDERRRRELREEHGKLRKELDG